jgi:hypothetical protein
MRSRWHPGSGSIVRDGEVVRHDGSQRGVPRSARPLPTPLVTLDAILLVSAMGWREQFESLFFATHDLALSAAARASGFEVLGTKQ